MAEDKEVMMTLYLNKLSRHNGLASVAMLCMLTAVSCTKQNDETTKSEPEVVVTLKPAIIEPVKVPAMACDDSKALRALNKNLRETLTGKTDRLLSTYSNRAGTHLGMGGVVSLIDSILIDVASPTELQPINASGMVTCKASLGMTLPNNDINRAKEVYNSIGGTSLSQTLSGQNITVNNNMLVSKSFSYVVGIQGGQTTAKIVGDPEILSAVADIAAKSKLKSTLDANRPVVQSRPQVQSPKRVQPIEQPKPIVVIKPKPVPKPTSQPTPKPNPNFEPASKPTAIISAAPKSNAPVTASNAGKFTVPTDDSIEMVIIEEDGTY